ncbi:hypothetical protein ABTY35_35210 [Streptomyces fimicarius]|uniref:hypothetical protein n=1 Tax=Streptomyces griseus TaxID=1911 RepID=UPI003321F484
MTTGLLRAPWGLVLTLANLLNAYIAYGALMIQPQGVWDEHTLTGIELASWLLIVSGVLTALLTASPVSRRPLSRWWLVPPLAFLVAGVARLQYIGYAYPVGNGG